MARPFAGEIRLIASERVPQDWLSCDGQLLPSPGNDLATAIGQNFGGDGANTFGLPDLRGRVPLHAAPAHPRGQAGGQETVALTLAQLSAHRHVLRASDSDGNRAEPGGAVWARSEARAFGAGPADASMNAAALASAGSGQPHENLMPFQGVRSIICVNGRDSGDSELIDVYRGEIRMFAIEAVPPGWVPCDGRLLSAQMYPDLFALVGTKFGGTSDMFAIPNLVGRVAIHRGAGRELGQPGGEELHALTTAELPAHAHQARAAVAPGDDPSPQGRSWGVQTAGLAYSDQVPDVDLDPTALADAGGNAAHDNMPPYLAVNFCMSLDGDDPTFIFAGTEPFIGEIRMFPYDVAPVGWTFCDGDLLTVDVSNDGPFTMLGFKYGGDGVHTFALPDLRGRAPLHPGQGPGLTARALGEIGGADAVTLTIAQLPAHTHDVRVQTAAGSATSPEGQVFATAPARALSAGYSSQAPTTPMSPLAATATGEGTPHNNMPPYLPIAFCIALNGETVP